MLTYKQTFFYKITKKKRGGGAGDYEFDVNTMAILGISLWISEACSMRVIPRRVRWYFYFSIFERDKFRGVLDET